jgi:hypothetical protein
MKLVVVAFQLYEFCWSLLIFYGNTIYGLYYKHLMSLVCLPAAWNWIVFIKYLYLCLVDTGASFWFTSTAILSIWGFGCRFCILNDKAVIYHINNYQSLLRPSNLNEICHWLIEVCILMNVQFLLHLFLQGLRSIRVYKNFKKCALTIDFSYSTWIATNAMYRYLKYKYIDITFVHVSPLVWSLSRPRTCKVLFLVGFYTQVLKS